MRALLEGGLGLAFGSSRYTAATWSRVPPTASASKQYDAIDWGSARRADSRFRLNLLIDAYNAAVARSVLSVLDHSQPFGGKCRSVSGKGSPTGSSVGMGRGWRSDTCLELTGFAWSKLPPVVGNREGGDAGLGCDAKQLVATSL